MTKTNWLEVAAGAVILAVPLSPSYIGPDDLLGLALIAHGFGVKI